MDLNKWQVLAAATALLDVENGGALQSKCCDHLSGRFSKFSAQKRSGRNPPRCSHLDSAHSADSQYQIAIKVTEPVLEAFRDGSVFAV